MPSESVRDFFHTTKETGMNPATPQAKSLRTKRSVLGLVFLFVGLALLVCNWRWISSAFHGPVQMSIAEVARIKDPSELPNPWVSFISVAPVETGMGLFEEGTKKPISRYILVGLAGKWLVAKVPYAYQGTRLTGCLETWSVPLRKKSLDPDSLALSAIFSASISNGCPV